MKFLKWACFVLIGITFLEFPYAEENMSSIEEFSYNSSPNKTRAPHASQAERRKARQIVEQAAQQSLEDLRSDQLAKRTQIALNALVENGVYHLARKGYRSESEKLRQEWQNNFSSYFLNEWTVYNLGDHAPLSQWLNRFYKKLEARLGRQLCEFLSLDDIQVFNYSIPVVFHPRGSHKDTWSKEEYRLHFVPFAAATIYWSTRLSCSIVFSMAISNICSFFAIIPRYATRDIFAPPLSDFIYDLAHHPERHSRAPQFDILAALSPRFEEL